VLSNVIGLFSQAIASSGFITSPWAVNKDPSFQFKKFIKKLHCDDKDDDMSDIYKCLRRKDAYKIARLATRVSVS